jgi:hypothetical protein
MPRYFARFERIFPGWFLTAMVGKGIIGVLKYPKKMDPDIPNTIASDNSIPAWFKSLVTVPDSQWAASL